MGKIRDFFKKIGDSKGAFHVKMNRIKDKNGKDLTEAEREVTRIHRKNYTKKLLMTEITTMVWSLTLSQRSWSVE